jgi:hypothetical protein
MDGLRLKNFRIFMRNHPKFAEFCRISSPRKVKDPIYIWPAIYFQTEYLIIPSFAIMTCFGTWALPKLGKSGRLSPSAPDSGTWQQFFSILRKLSRFVPEVTRPTRFNLNAVS